MPKRKPEYVAWCSLRARCNNPKSFDYHWAGGRGIKHDPSWNCFSKFLADVGERPGPNYSLQRTHPDADYGPETTAWRPRERQNRIRRPLRLVPIDGNLVSMRQAEKMLGLGSGTIAARLKRGWTLERALTP
jgi:hypothetical protein